MLRLVSQDFFDLKIDEQLKCGTCNVALHSQQVKVSFECRFAYHYVTYHFIRCSLSFTILKYKNFIEITLVMSKIRISSKYLDRKIKRFFGLKIQRSILRRVMQILLLFRFIFNDIKKLLRFRLVLLYSRQMLISSRHCQLPRQLKSINFISNGLEKNTLFIRII